MKLFPITIVAVASLTVSCQSITTKSGAVVDPASGLGTTSPEMKTGMGQDEIRSSLGTPSYQYRLEEKEVWVYEDCNQLVKRTKETALNMVPVVGPTVTLLGDLKPKTRKAKAEVTFDSEGKVISYSTQAPYPLDKAKSKSLE